MFLVAASFVAAFALNTWTEVTRPQGAGFTRTGRFGLQVATVVPGGPFEKAGIRPGDVLRAVDERRLASVLDWALVRTALELGKPFTVEVERGDSRRRFTATLERRSLWVWETQEPPGWQLAIVASAYEGATLVSLTLSLIVGFRRPHDPVARLAAWLLASIAVVPGTPTGQLALLRHVPPPVQLLAVAGLTLSMAQPAAWLCFFATFPRRLLTRPLHVALAILPGVLLASYFAIWFVGPLYFPRELDGPAPWPFWLFVLGLALAAEIGGLAILIYNYLRAHDLNERRKLRVLLAGTTIGWSAAVASSFPFQIVGQHVALATFLSVFGVLVSLALPFAFAYAILRQRIFDIGFIVRQGLQYALARGVVRSVLPAAGAMLLADLMLHRDRTVGAILAARGWPYAAIGAFAFVALRRREAWLEAVDRRFFRERYNAQHILRQVAGEVRQAVSIDLVGARVVSRIEAALHTEFAAMLVREPHDADYRTIAAAPSNIVLPTIKGESKTIGLLRLLEKPLQIGSSGSGWLRQLPPGESDVLRRARIDLLVPVSLGAGGREALLALGPKKSEEPYGHDDQELLLAIASNLAILLDRPAATQPESGSRECPACGRCYESTVERCTLDQAVLTRASMPRTVVGRYRVEQRLGRGGMGTVYRAHDVMLERRVALKAIREDLVSSAEMAERFRREARAAAAVTHPNLVTLHDFVIDPDNRAFLVMELLTGCTLRQRLRERGPLPPAAVLEIVRGVSAGLATAHQRGLVHRDLKPENIFLVADVGRDLPKVLDFGLAKLAAADDDPTRATFDTRDSVVVGTTAYMSPEQLTGAAVSLQWDLWALAVVMYEMLTGALPFGSQLSVAALQNAILTGRVTPLAIHIPHAPSSWQTFVSSNLHLDPTRRAQSAAEFLAACEGALTGDPERPH